MTVNVAVFNITFFGSRLTPYLCLLKWHFYFNLFFTLSPSFFVNPYGNRSGLPENVVHFLDYIRDNRAGDSFTEELEQAVKKARAHKEVVSSFL